MIPADDPLSAEERAAILAEADRVNAIPPGVNTSSPGCALLLLAVVLFVVGPPILRHVGAGTLAVVLKYLFLAVELTVIVMGIYWYFRGSGGAYAQTVVRAEKAIETIKSTYPAGRRTKCGEAIARLLASSSYSDGPGMSSTFKVEEARQQLGEAMPFVIAVERFLVGEHKVSPVFTLDEYIAERKKS